MTFARKSIAASAALFLSATTSATSVTLTSGDSTMWFDYMLSGLAGSGQLTFSSSLIGALNAGKVQVSAVAPATLPVVYKTQVVSKVITVESVTAIAPITSISADIPDGGLSQLAVTQATTAGGARLSAPSANIATTGGSLEITNLRVDLVGKKVYADLNGANGVGVKTGIYLWDIGSVSGSTVFDNMQSFNGYPGSTDFRSISATLSGLTINQPAFDLFAQAMGLTSNGITSLKTVTDFGVINSTITLGVPEPSTYALMGLGLVGIGLAARRRRAA